MAFDKNKPYGSVSGQHGAVDEQGGRFYTADGNEVIEAQEGEAAIPDPVDPAQPEDAAPRRGRRKAAQPENAAPAGEQDSQLAAQLGEPGES